MTTRQTGDLQEQKKMMTRERIYIKDNDIKEKIKKCQKDKHKETLIIKEEIGHIDLRVNN